MKRVDAGVILSNGHYHSYGEEQGEGELVALEPVLPFRQLRGHRLEELLAGNVLLCEVLFEVSLDITLPRHIRR